MANKNDRTPQQGQNQNPDRQRQSGGGDTNQQGIKGGNVKQGQQGQGNPGQGNFDRERQGQSGQGGNMDADLDRKGQTGQTGQAGRGGQQNIGQGQGRDKTGSQAGQQRSGASEEDLSDISKGVTDEEDLENEDRITQRNPSQGGNVDRDPKR